MAEFRFVLNTDGMEQKFSLLVNESKDLTAPLREFSKYLQKKAKDRFASQGPGWAPLAQGTVERLQHTRTARVTAHGKLRKSSEQAVRQKLARDVRAGKASKLAFRELAVATGRATRTDQLAVSVRNLLGSKNKTVAKVETDLQKAAGKSAEQRRRGKRKIEKHKLLGKLASTLTATISSRRMDVFSRAGEIGAIHNEGGTAGHGARIPARTFLEFDKEDLEVLARLVEGKLFAAFEE